MKFLVDAQLPVRLARFIQASGYDTITLKIYQTKMRRQIMKLMVYQFNKIEF